MGFRGLSRRVGRLDEMCLVAYWISVNKKVHAPIWTPFKVGFITSKTCVENVKKHRAVNSNPLSAVLLGTPELLLARE